MPQEMFGYKINHATLNGPKSHLLRSVHLQVVVFLLMRLPLQMQLAHQPSLALRGVMVSYWPDGTVSLLLRVQAQAAGMGLADMAGAL